LLLIENGFPIVHLSDGQLVGQAHVVSL
jgi:hypothetical protein